jgi:hypothetical protein
LCWVGALPVGGQAQEDSPFDLAALLLHSDDLDWLVEGKDIRGTADDTPYGLQYSSGFTTLEDALDEEIYALGRGGFKWSEFGPDKAAGILGDAGWLRAFDAFFALPDSVSDDRWTYGVAATIEEFETSQGAAEAFDAFGDEQTLRTLTVSTEVAGGATGAFDGLPGSMWVLETNHWGGRVGQISIWVQVDNLIVSVSLLNAEGNGVPNPALVEEVMKHQLKRLAYAEHLYQPGLSACAARLGGEGVFALRDEYTVLNGTTFAFFNDTFDDLDEVQVEVNADGIVDSYYVSQRIDGTRVGAFDGTMYFRSDHRSFVSDDDARAYLDTRGGVLEENPEYSEVEAIADIPELGDDARAYTYLGAEGFTATIVYVQLENQVLTVRLGSTTEMVLDSLIELTEAQIERMENGECDEPMELPGGLLAALVRHA